MSRLDEVGEAEGWRCWLCDELVDPDMSVNDPRGPSIDLRTTRSKAKAKAKEGSGAQERLAHRGCNTGKGATTPEVPWPDQPYVADPAPLIPLVGRLGRKGGREVTARCMTRDDADAVAAWLIDRIGRLEPGLAVTTQIDEGGGQLVVSVHAWDATSPDTPPWQAENHGRDDEGVVMDDGLQVGTIELGMAGPLAVGPNGIVFTADSRAAKVYAVDVEAPDRGPAADGPLDVDDIDVRLGAFLGCDADDVVIRDLLVQPGSGDVLLSVQRGQGDAGTAVLLRLRRDDVSIEEVALDGVRMAEWSLDDAPAPDDERTEMSVGIDEGDEVTYGDLTFRLVTRPIRTATVTDLVHVDGTLLVAGLSNEEFASKLRRIPFPFGPGGDDSSLEIFHVSHGAWETAAPIRTFVPYDEGRSILASYTCTPVVHFPLADIGAETKAVGRTIAELGAVNTPLDMTTFRDTDGEHLLVANTTHGLLKIDCADIDGQAPLTEAQGPRGVPRETSDLQGVVRLANLDDRHVLVLQRDADGRRQLRTVKTESL